MVRSSNKSLVHHGHMIGSMKFASIADVHIRPLTRHDEIRIVFEAFVEGVKSANVDHVFIGGDVWHTKCTGISAEYIDLMTWLLKLLGDAAETHIILGNHDFNEKNKNRQDAISPIVNAVAHPRVHLYRDSGVYNIAPGYNLCVFSIVDEENWGIVEPIEGDVNIACFHGSVNGCKLESGMEMLGGVPLDMFQGYDACFLGDIHKFQWLDQREHEIEIDEEDLSLYPDAVVING